MILHKKTYQKFGYWPKDLPHSSHKKVAVKCGNCKNVRYITKDGFNFLKSGKGTCKKCRLTDEVKEKIRQGNLNKTNIIKNGTMPVEITPQLWLHLYESVSLTNGTLQSNRKYFGVKESWSLYKGLGLAKAPTSTETWKNYLLIFLSKQSPPYIGEVVNRVVIQHMGRSSALKIHLNCSSKRYGKIFSLTDDFHFYTTKDGCYTCDKGSFYIDGRWIHVGN